MILQVGILRIMDVYGTRDSMLSVGGLIDSEEPAPQDFNRVYAAFLSPSERKVVDQADQMKPLCVRKANGTYACSPPSISYVSRWHSLDTNGDGLWTMSEAMAFENATESKSTSHERMSVDHWILKRPTVVFNQIVAGLKQRAAYVDVQHNKTLFISPEVAQRKAIPKAYFHYWMGDAMFCSRFERSACESIVASGLFDAALTKGHLAAEYKGISDYTTATQYCQMMLEEDGGCETTLPISYKQNNINRRDMCGKVTLHGENAATNPRDPSEQLPIMYPSFSNLSLNEQASASLFLMFKILLMYLFYTSLADEARDLIGFCEFLSRFPGLKHQDDIGGYETSEKEQAEGQKRYKITGLAFTHRACMWFLFILRVLIFLVLVKFGSWFLLTESRYIELVLNALALNFITGIDEVMYSTFLLESSDEQYHGLDDVERIRHPSIIPGSSHWFGYTFKKEFWGLVIIPLAAIGAVLWNNHFVRQPIIEALTCTCLQQGDHCAESMVLQKDWWQQYWTHTLPAAIHQIEALRLQAMGGT
jgi:hypothetical protein